VFRSICPPLSSFGFDEVQTLLRQGGLTYPRVRCSDGTGDIDPVRYTRSSPERFDPEIDAGKLFELLRSQTVTVRINRHHEQDARFGAAARTLRAACDAEVNANLYLTSSAGWVIPGHRDGHHVLVVQLDGSKTFMIGDLDDPEAPVGDLSRSERRVVLEPGDGLYLPRGIAHVARAAGRSLHCAFGIRPRTHGTALNALIGEGSRRRSSPFRAEVGLMAERKASVEQIALIRREALAELTFRSHHELSAGRGDVVSDLGAKRDLNTSCVDPHVSDRLAGLEQAARASSASLYLRGSAARGATAPWDVDVVVVGELEPAIDLVSMGDGGAPEIDLTIVSVEELINCPQHALKRTLLECEGVLLAGVDVRRHFAPVPIPARASQIGAVYLEVIERKRRLIARMDPGDAIDVRRAAKAALRYASAPALAAGFGFFRSPALCVDFLCWALPGLVEEIDLVWLALRTGVVPPKAVAEAIEQLEVSFHQIQNVLERQAA